tara:strand:+ start:53 stop:253 length:201 start_codon:yes stop_codon:yes gene_type:complete
MLIKIFFLVKNENKKKPTATIKNLKLNAANGSLLSTIGFVVMKADDHKRTNIKGKNFVILKEKYYF